jgi:hypothetical protein
MTLSCPHPVDQVEKVVLTNGTVVAALCGVCLSKIPLNWGCTDCEWVEVRRMCDARPTLLPGLPCKQHA